MSQVEQCSREKGAPAVRARPAHGCCQGSELVAKTERLHFRQGPCASRSRAQPKASTDRVSTGIAHPCTAPKKQASGVGVVKASPSPTPYRPALPLEP